MVDIIDINVFQSVNSISFEVEPITNIININKITVSGGEGGIQDLQAVTDVGATTTKNITANAFIKIGATGTNLLLDNGNTIPTTSIVSSTNLTPTQTATNFTINSDTGTDATIPLGNGTLAGATINDYTTTEKNKLAGIQDGAEVNVNADWNAVSGDAQILNKPTIPIVTGFVPYTGATTNVDLGEYEIKAGQVTLDITPTGTPAVGTTQWNDSLGATQTTLKGGNVVLKNGVDLIARIVNKVTPNTTLTKANYQAVRVSGATGQRLSVELAQGDGDLNSADTIGLVTETIDTNQEGFIITMGQIEEINTTGSLQGETWLDGDVLYLSPTAAGRLTNIKPTGATGHIVVIGYVEYAHAIHGKIYVKIMNGWELDELHNVFIDNALANEDFLQYESSTSLWKNKPLTDTLIKSKLGITTLSGDNTGDNATNTQYSGLATSKQDTLQNTVNIKSINGTSILGSGDLTISGTGISSLNGLTGATQTFSATTNTSSLIPAWSSSGTNHQLNIPVAGAANVTGLITGGSQFISGSKQFQSNPEIPVPAGNSGSCIVLGTTGGGGATGTLQIGSTTLYPTALEMQYVKGITSSVQTQLNNKASIIDVAEQTYSLSPTFTVTAPTTIVANTYKWSQVGSLVTVRVNLSYTTAGSFTTVVIPLPTDMPTPLSPTGFTAASDILYYGTGSFTTTTSTSANLARVTFLRRNAANNGYEFVMIYTTAIAARVVTLTLQYFTE